MSKVRMTVNSLLVIVCIAAFASVANAQATRTWVSGVGDDANPCSRTAPCKTFAGAISKTARDGEISVLDPGGFGAITITKSITINGTVGQGYGSILASSVSGVTINITDAADLRKTVRLNWLDINGAPSSSPGLTGIRILAASAVHVENTVIDSFRSTTSGFGHGIHVNVAATCELHVRNTTIRNNLNDGIRLQTTAGQVIASIVNSKISKNATGIHAVNGVVAQIVNCELAANSAIGIDAEEGALSTQLNIEGCHIAFSGTAGVQAGSGASEVRLSNNFINQNGTGVSIAGGQVFTSGNNRLVGNSTAVGGGALQPVTPPV
jgi:parallel beta helix pectate lyase-like protein